MAAAWISEAPLPSWALSPSNWQTPPDACDAHMHVFGDRIMYPADAAARYTWPDANLEAYGATAKTLGLSRCVLVQPSFYADDNRLLLSLVKSSPIDAVGVAMMPAKASVTLFEEWSAFGIRGVRVDLFKARSQGQSSAEVTRGLQSTAKLASTVGWSVDIYAPGKMILEQAHVLSDLPVQTTIAHLGYLTAQEGISEGECEDVVRQFAASNVWVKLTGAYRFAEDEARRAKFLAHLWLSSIPNRLLWGTDWPHVMAPRQDSGALLNQLVAWCPDESKRKKILVDNPDRLYGFSSRRDPQVLS